MFNMTVARDDDDALTEDEISFLSRMPRMPTTANEVELAHELIRRGFIWSGFSFSFRGVLRVTPGFNYHLTDKGKAIAALLKS